MQSTTPSPACSQNTGCPECYFYGVCLALVGSSLQALGLQMWKLHFMRSQKAQELRENEALRVERMSNEQLPRIEEQDSHQSSVKTQPSDVIIDVDKDEGRLHGRKGCSLVEGSCDLVCGSVEDPEPYGITDIPVYLPQSANDLRPGHQPSHLQSPEVLSSTQGSPNIYYEDYQGTIADMPGTGEAAKGSWKDLFLTWIWGVGFVVFAVGNAMDFVALGITKQSVVTLVGSWTLAINTLLARCLLGERTIYLDYVAVVVIFGGIAMTVFGSNSCVKDLTIKELVDQYRKGDVVVMLLVLASIIGFCFFIIIMDKIKRVRAKRRGIELEISRNIGTVYCESDSASCKEPMLTFSCSLSRPRRLFRSNVHSAVREGAPPCRPRQSLTSLPCQAFSGLLIPTLLGDNQFTEPFVVLVVMVFLISLPLQLVLINVSLSVNDALFHIPNFYGEGSDACRPASA
eukprot:288313-Hanusia_phi.AAC.2